MTTCLHASCSPQMTDRTNRHVALMGGSMGEYGWWGNGRISGSWVKDGEMWKE